MTVRAALCDAFSLAVSRARIAARGVAVAVAAPPTATATMTTTTTTIGGAAIDAAAITAVAATRDAPPPDASGPALRHASQGLRCGEFHAGRDFNRARWDPVASNCFLDDRAWCAVDALARACVRGVSSSGTEPTPATLGEALSMPDARVDNAFGAAALDGNNKQRLGRAAYKARVWYHGPSFAGFAWNAATDNAGTTTWTPGSWSVSRALTHAWAPLLDKETRPIASAGRTDRGVHAVASAVSFWTKRLDVDVEDIERAVANSLPGRVGALRVTHVTSAPHSFHATFSATYRRYVYVVPKTQLFREARTPRASIDVDVANRALQRLVDRGDVDMYAYARATPKGKSMQVRFVVARAFERTIDVGGVDAVEDQAEDAMSRANRRSRSAVTRERAIRAEDGDGAIALASASSSSTMDVIVIELVADRFLRKLVRCLVSTTMREAANFAGDDDVLLNIAATRDRRAVAPPAPPGGLFFAGVSYSDDFETTRGS